MGNTPFPYSTSIVVSSIVKLLEAKGQHQTVELLRMAKPRIEETGYDNWNNGIIIYTLYLYYSVEAFAKIESRVKNAELVISSKLSSLFRGEDWFSLRSVVIAPDLSDEKLPHDPAEIEERGKHLWQPGTLRLFLSHISLHKKSVSLLKDELQTVGVTAFVAHEDIEPTLDWQREIENALLSMNALAALITPGFKESNWTDQEIGIAVGRGTLVIPIRLGLDPYGFISKQQAITGNLEQPKELAGLIVDTLLRQPSTSSNMTESLVVALERSGNFMMSLAIAPRFESLTKLTQEQMKRVQLACKENDQVYRAFGVTERISQVLKKLEKK